MTGNEVGDRVHNFFARDNLPQGQYHSQVADGIWPSLNNSFWAGSQKQVGVATSSPRNNNSLQSDFGRGDNGHPLHVTHGLDFTQTNLRSDFANSQPQSQQQDFSGYTYGRQNFPARQDEANFLRVDTESDRHGMNPRGSFVFESQQGGVSENISNNSARCNASDTPVTYNIFGGQQSGFADMQQLQHLLMFRKIQELQRQKKLQRQRTNLNHGPSFSRQASGDHPWGDLTSSNSSWQQRVSASSGFVFSPEQGQAPPAMGFAHQQVDQSLYAMFPDQVTTQLGTLPSWQSLQGKSPHDNAPVQEFQRTQELIGLSESLQNKKANDDTVALDPAEEKILFGSDDNIWDAFGTDTITGEGASNLLDDNDFSNGFPSLQSGSWSALMQSAVAETSSSDIGVHEELAGLSCQNAELATGTHQLPRDDGGEQHQITFAENLGTGPAVSLGSIPNFDGANTNEKFRNALGFMHGERHQSNSSKRLNPQSSGGSKLFNYGSVQKLHAEGSEIYDNIPRSLEVRMDGNSSLSHWTSQQSGSSQLVSKANNWSGIESAALSGDISHNLSTGEYSLQHHSQSNNWKRGQHEDIGHADSIWKVKSAPKSLGSPKMISEGFAVNVAESNLSSGAPAAEDTSQLNSASTQNDLEAFGHSLKPNNFHQTYSLPNQMQAMKDSDSDPSHRGSKRLKRPDVFLGGQQFVSRTGHSNESNNMVADVTVRDTTVSSTDSNMLSFSGRVDNGEKSMQPQLGSVLLSYAHGNSISSVKAEHTQISPQMAPSWFDQYGTLKNGQTLSMPEMPKGATVKTVEQPINLGISAGGLVIDNSKEAIMHNLTPASISIERLSSPLPANVSDKNSVALRQMKRKSFHPWHKEISQSSPYPLALSMAEAEWAIAANQRIEKVKDGGEVIIGIAPITRSRKRFVLTIQLMQQLFRPLPGTILSEDASLNYEIVPFFVARLALGDACNLASFARCSSDVPQEGSNSSNLSERIDLQHLSEAVENFIDRARKLENDLLSMDKRASILDLRVECQDLEKFSVINRFAKFHTRGQSNGSDTTANAKKPVPQRYVTAVPLPKNLPDSVHSLSL